jgi:hypothetical protein
MKYKTKKLEKCMKILQNSSLKIYYNENMNNKIALESLVMDLKRVAIGYHRNSLNMANRFYEEALKRKSEIDTTTLRPYILRFIKRIDVLTNQEQDAVADEALLISTLLQNYTQKFL